MKFCTQCGTQLSDTSVICPNCGAKVESAVNQGPAPEANQQYAQPQQQYAQPQYIPPQPVVNEEAALPERFKPLSALAYFGYSLLFTIPIVGFIFAIVFAVSSEGNINRRNYARGYLIGLLVAFIISIIIAIITAVAGISIFTITRGGYSYY